MNFIEEMKSEQAKIDLISTENGALGHRSTGKNLLDMNFRISSYRNMSEDKIIQDFMKAYADDSILAIKWLFYARDVRGGAGERRLFRVIYDYLIRNDVEVAKKFITLIPEYGRYDDLFIGIGTEIEKDTVDFIRKQFNSDIVGLGIGREISLLAKWMPSENASSKETKVLAEKFAKWLGMSNRNYRKILSKLRGYLNVVEKDMSANRWDKISYSGVPSKANIVYKGAFMKHDEARRTIYLEDVANGVQKINSSTNFPHDIAKHYMTGSAWGYTEVPLDNTIEALWKALPEYGELSNTLVVADGSGSMFQTIGETNTSALHVANALAVYFAERNKGDFKNKYVTFSSRPQIVNLGDGTLKSKIDIAMTHNEVSNTNIESVFNLILNTAISMHMTQLDLPETILCISDMEFDYMTEGRMDSALFEDMRVKFEENGYKLPKLVFWNVMSTSLAIPVIENELGVNLVSGFSPSAIKMVLSGILDPYSALLSVLNSERYKLVEDILK